MFTRTYSLHKSRRLLRKGYALYKKRSSDLLTSQYAELERTLQALDKAAFERDRKEASRLAKNLESFIHTHFPKSFFASLFELLFALLFAFVVAFCIRQFWFELYEVPTGSMRPTILEKDRLIVSKTPFGIHFPFTKGLWLFHPDRIQRGGMVTFTTEDMNLPDSDIRDFWIFPAKKRFVKRSIARGGDNLYFYGGRLYILDKSGQEITTLHDPTWLTDQGMDHINHIPFISFEGKSKQHNREILLYQMNQPLGKISVGDSQFFNGNEWQKENLEALKERHEKPMSYGDMWGINNYAMARLLTKKEAEKLYPQNKEEAPFFLELRHTPHLFPSFSTFSTLLPLSEEQLTRLMDHMTTMRFVVQKGHAYRYTEGKKRMQPPQFDPRLAIPDGTYEFYKGKAYAIHFAGIRTALPASHPLYARNPEHIQTLFNFGTNFNTLYQPMQVEQPFFPQRFAFYREGVLFVMDEPFLTKEESHNFTEKEVAKQNASSALYPYIAFIDRGAPPNKEFIKTFGLHIPEGSFLALGDNYANSSDSRDFGFVPEQNLRGAPSFHFWPFSSRLGPFPQPSYPWITLPNFIVWSVVALIFLLLWLYKRYRDNRRLF